jgi:hypothetical protein
MTPEVCYSITHRPLTLNQHYTHKAVELSAVTRPARTRVHIHAIVTDTATGTKQIAFHTLENLTWTTPQQNYLHGADYLSVFALNQIPMSDEKN